jgi:hypothetical protein
VSTKSILLGSICALVFGAASPALADGFSGMLTGDYANVNVKNGGGSGNVWGGSAQGSQLIGDAVSADVDGGFHRAEAFGGHADLWNFDGALSTLINKGGRLGATIGYNTVDFSGLGTVHATNYGLFGEWWANDMLTVGGKVGGFDGSGVNGYYGSAMLKGYYMPDLALAGSIDHTHANNNGDATAYTLSAEYLVSEATPISVGGGYTYTNLAGVHADTWFLSVNFYCNGDSGASTLRDRQRAAGTLGWDTGFGGLLTKF